MVNNSLNNGDKSADPPATVSDLNPLPADRLVTIHDMRQALNVLRITAGNIGVRLRPGLDAADTAYLDRRLGVIDDQVQALAAMTEVLCAQVNGAVRPAN